MTKDAAEHFKQMAKSLDKNIHNLKKMYLSDADPMITAHNTIISLKRKDEQPGDMTRIFLSADKNGVLSPVPALFVDDHMGNITRFTKESAEGIVLTRDLSVSSPEGNLSALYEVEMISEREAAEILLKGLEKMKAGIPTSDEIENIEVPSKLSVDTEEDVKKAPGCKI